MKPNRTILTSICAGLLMLAASVAFAWAPPCGGSYVTSTKPITVPSAAATVVISNHSSTANVIYVCSWHLLNSGGGSTLEYGTGALCATGTVALTGVLGSTDTITQTAQAAEIFKIPPGNDVCVLGASSAAGTGWITYTSPNVLNP